MYTLAYLESLTTLSTAQADNLKIETENTRVWLCRCGIADGMPFENMVTIETLKEGRWEVLTTYEAK